MEALKMIRLKYTAIVNLNISILICVERTYIIKAFMYNVLLKICIMFLAMLYIFSS